MAIAANIMVGVVAILHLGFLVVEMFLWNKPFGLKTFGMTQQVADASRTLAANQGLYNGFLAAGLSWGLLSNILVAKVFFLICVIVAGVFGGFTAKRSILYIQALPGAIGLLLLALAR